MVPITLTLPETTKILGSRTLFIVPLAGVVDPAVAKVSEIAAGFKATVYTYGDDVAIVSGEQQKGDAPKKTAEKKTREQLGTVKETISDFQYSYGPQKLGTDNSNKMKAGMVMGTKVVVYERLGVDEPTAVSTADYFNVYVCTLGYQNRTMTGTGEFDEYSVTQSAVVDRSFYDVKAIA